MHPPLSFWENKSLKIDNIRFFRYNKEALFLVQSDEKISFMN